MSTIDDEHRIQPFMDSWYAERGLSIDRSGSCRQYDCVLKNGSRSFSVEEKFNFQGHEYDQMIVELIQALEAGELAADIKMRGLLNPLIGRAIEGNGGPIEAEE